jgi:ribosomal protein S18 acetylase RimI-like enzyme
LSTFAEALPGSQASIEPATWRDLNSLRHLEQVCFPKDAWPLLDLVGVLTLPSVVRLKALVGGAFAGFVAGDVRRSQKEAWIATIAVLPEFRGRGVGRKLLRACESQLEVPRVRLCVRASNAAAVQLYLSEGYHKSGLWANYYQDGEEAVIMEKGGSG